VRKVGVPELVTQRHGDDKNISNFRQVLKVRNSRKRKPQAIPRQSRVTITTIKAAFKRFCANNVRKNDATVQAFKSQWREGRFWSGVVDRSSHPIPVQITAEPLAAELGACYSLFCVSTRDSKDCLHPHGRIAESAVPKNH